MNDTYEELRKYFEVGAPNWPVIYRKPPKFWQRARVREEKRAKAGLRSIGKSSKITQQMRHDYWAQKDIGQSVYEDAGGYFWRCWSAMLGFEFDPPVTYEDAARALMRGKA